MVYWNDKAVSVQSDRFDNAFNLYLHESINMDTMNLRENFYDQNTKELTELEQNIKTIKDQK
jgi:hypothetical protein